MQNQQMQQDIEGLQNIIDTYSDELSGIENNQAATAPAMLGATE
jgi:hypothetical protein